MIGVESPNNAKLFYHFNLEKKVRVGLGTDWISRSIGAVMRL